MKCTHCDINWLYLLQDEQDDHVYHVCPLCKSDMHLVESEGEKFYLDLKGNIVSTNGQIRAVVTPEPPPVPPCDPNMLRCEIEFKSSRKHDRDRSLEDKIIEAQY